MPGRSRKRLDSKAEPPKGIKQAFHILGTCIAGGIGFVSGLFKMILAVIAGGLVISCIAGGILYIWRPSHCYAPPAVGSGRSSNRYKEYRPHSGPCKYNTSLQHPKAKCFRDHFKFCLRPGL